jgi:hypothetical protein
LHCAVTYIGDFINKSSIILDEVCELCENLDDSIILLKRYFGEILMANNFEIDDDPWSGFFTTLVDFATMHKHASKELIDLEKKRKQQECREASIAEKIARAKEQQATGVMKITAPSAGGPDEASSVISATKRGIIGSPKQKNPNTGKIDICEIFKERMLALNGDESDSEEEW